MSMNFLNYESLKIHPQLKLKLSNEIYLGKFLNHEGLVKADNWDTTRLPIFSEHLP